MQSTRMAPTPAPPQEGPLSWMVPSVAPTTAPPLTAQEESQRQANLQQALSMSLIAAQGGQGWLAQSVLNSLKDILGETTVGEYLEFVNRRLPFILVTISEDPSVRERQLLALSTLEGLLWASGLGSQRQQSGVEQQPDALMPIAITDRVFDESGHLAEFRVANNWYLPCPDEQKELLAGVLQTANDANLSYSELSQFFYFYGKLMNAFSSTALLQAKAKLYGGGVEGVLNGVIENCKDSIEALFSVLKALAERRQDAGQLISDAGAKIENTENSYQYAFRLIADWLRTLQFPEISEDESQYLSGAEAEIFKSYLQLYNGISEKLRGQEYNFAAKILGIPPTAESSAYFGAELSEVPPESLALYAQRNSALAVLSLFGARARVAELSSKFEQYADEIDRYYRHFSPSYQDESYGPYGNVEDMLDEAGITGEKRDFILHWREYLVELNELLPILADYGDFLERTATRDMPELVSIFGSDAIIQRFSGVRDGSDWLRSPSLEARHTAEAQDADAGVAGATVSGAYEEEFQEFGTIAGRCGDFFSSVESTLSSLSTDAASYNYDQGLFAEYREGGLWEGMYAYSKYFLKYGANDFLFWSSVATLGLGLLAEGAIAVTGTLGRTLAGDMAVGQATSQAMRSFLSYDIVGGTGAATASRGAAAALAEGTFARYALNYGFRLASTINVAAGTPVWLNAMKYFSGDRSDVVYEDLALMEYFMTTRGAAGGTSLIGRIGATGAFGFGGVAAFGKTIEDLRRREYGSALADIVFFMADGVMAVRTGAGVLRFADSASAAGRLTIGTASGPAELVFGGTAGKVEGQLMRWVVNPAIQPFQPLGAFGFLGFYGLHAGLAVARLLWQDIPDLAIAYEEGGIQKVREHISSTYFGMAMEAPIFNILFHVPSNIAQSIRGGARAGAEVTTASTEAPSRADSAMTEIPGGAESVSTEGPVWMESATTAPGGMSQITMQIPPTLNPMRTLYAEAAGGASSVAEKVAADAGLMGGSAAEVTARSMALRQIALTETRFTEEEILARLGLEDTAAARQFARTLNSELDSIWVNADILASGRQALTTAEERSMKQMLENAATLRRGGLGPVGRGIAIGAAVAVPMAVAEVSSRIFSRFPEAAEIVDKREALLEYLGSRDNLTNNFLDSLSNGLFTGFYRHRFNAAEIQPFQYIIAALLRDVEDVVVNSDRGFDFSAINGAFPDRDRRIDLIVSIFLSLSSKGRLVTERGFWESLLNDPLQNLSYYENILMNVSSRLKELKEDGMDFSAMGFSDIFFLVDFCLNRSHWNGFREGIRAQRGLMDAERFSVDYKESESQLYYSQWCRVYSLAFAYAMGHELGASWATQVCNSIFMSVTPAQVVEWESERIYALFESPLFASPEAMMEVNPRSLSRAVRDQYSDIRFPESVYNPEFFAAPLAGAVPPASPPPQP